MIEGGVLVTSIFNHFFLEKLIHFINQSFSIDKVFVLISTDDIRFEVIILIWEVANDHFDEVMEGDDPFCSSEFILDDGDILFLFSEGIQDHGCGGVFTENDRFRYDLSK